MRDGRNTLAINQLDQDLVGAQVEGDDALRLANSGRWNTHCVGLRNRGTGGERREETQRHHYCRS